MLIEKSRNGWELHTISNGRLSCEKYDLEASDSNTDKIERDIHQKFGSVIDEEGIMVSGDNWSGVFIMQMPGMDTNSSDEIIREIYRYFSLIDIY